MGGSRYQLDLVEELASGSDLAGLSNRAVATAAEPNLAF
jgi:hypothetical protein